MAPLTLVNIERRSRVYADDTCVPPSVRSFCSRIASTAREAIDAATAESGAATGPSDDDFVGTITAGMIHDSIPHTAVWQWCADLIERRFSNTILVTQDRARRHKRVGMALLVRMQELEVLDDSMEIDVFVKECDRYESRCAHVTGENSTPTSATVYAQQTAPATTQADPRHSARRTVQQAFEDSGERGRFSGDLEKEPSFELWNNRFSQLADSFEHIDRKEKVSLLSEALSGPALSFYHKEICSQPVKPSLAQALASIEQRFCTEQARNVLKQTLDQTTLRDICSEENISRPAALLVLKERIRRLSANGPSEFRSEACQIAALRKALVGESWAVAPLVNAADRAAKEKEDKCLEHYIQTLISFLRETENLSLSQPSDRLNPHVAHVSEPEAHEVMFGMERAAPRLKGGARRNGSGSFNMRDLLERSPASGGSSGSGGSWGKQPSGSSRRPPPPRRGKDICFRCGRRGHYARDCPQPAASVTEAVQTMYTTSDAGADEVAAVMAAAVENLSQDTAPGDKVEEPHEEVEEGFEAFLASFSRLNDPENFC